MANQKTEFKVKGEDLVKKVRQLIREGNIRRIIIKDTKDHVFMEIPLTVGILSTVLIPVWAALGTLAVLVAKFTIEVVNMDAKPRDTKPKDAKPKDAKPRVAKTRVTKTRVGPRGSRQK